MLKYILSLIIIISSVFAQSDHLNSEPVEDVYDHVMHLERDKSYSVGSKVLRSDVDGSTVDTSGMFITDTTIGARIGSRLLQGGEIIYSTAADLNLLQAFVDSGYILVIDSSGYLLDTPRTIWGWSNNLTFSATDYNTVAWTSGSIYFANLDTFDIVSGNTGNIGALTYIYFDETVSETILQTTTNSGNAVGLGRVIIAVARPTGDTDKLAVFNVFGNNGFSLVVGTTQISDNAITTDLILANTILAGDIASNTITANELAANSVRTSEILFASLDQDSVITSINADANGLYINAENIQIGGATLFTIGYDPSDGSFVIYQLSAPSTRPSGDALQNGDSWIDTTAAQGNIPKIWDGTQWRTMYTFINGGFIKTGTVDADRIDVDGIFATNMEVSGTGEIHSTGKDSYSDNTAGFWLGWDSPSWKFNIGNATEHLKWDGSNLYINDAVIDDATQTDGTIIGSIIKTASSGDRVEMDASGLRLYDVSGGVGSQIRVYDNTTLSMTMSGISFGTHSGYGWTTDDGEDLIFVGDDNLILEATGQVLYGDEGLFSVYKTATQTFNTGAANLFSSNTTEKIDLGADFSSGVFTADKTAYYQFTVHANIENTESDVGWYRLYIVADGETFNTYFRNTLTSGTFLTLELKTPPVLMSASSTAICYIQRDAGTANGRTLSGSSHTWFGGERIR